MGAFDPDSINQAADSLATEQQRMQAEQEEYKRQLAEIERSCVDDAFELATRLHRWATANSVEPNWSAMPPPPAPPRKRSWGRKKVQSTPNERRARGWRITTFTYQKGGIDISYGQLSTEIKGLLVVSTTCEVRYYYDNTCVQVGQQAVERFCHEFLASIHKPWSSVSKTDVLKTQKAADQLRRFIQHDVGNLVRASGIPFS